MSQQLLDIRAAWKWRPTRQNVIEGAARRKVPARISTARIAPLFWGNEIGRSEKCSCSCQRSGTFVYVRRLIFEVWPDPYPEPSIPPKPLRIARYLAAMSSLDPER